MQDKRNSLCELARKVQEGDSSATDEFLTELGPPLARIVRWVMRTGAADSAIAQRIATEFSHLLSEGWTEHDREMLIKAISARIAQATVERIRVSADLACLGVETVLDPRRTEVP